MIPARLAIHECRMQFPQHRAPPRNHIVGIATLTHTIENSPNRIARKTTPSALATCPPPRARGPAHSRVDPLIRTWARSFARGSDGMRVGSTPRAGVRWYARQRRPGAYLGVEVRIAGLTRMFSGSCASDTPGQAPLRPQRRPPRPRHPIVGVCYRGGLHCGRRRPEARPHRQQAWGVALHGDPCVSCLPVTSPPNGGNCTIRGATRRRHADRTLLMLQNPHHYPGIMLPHWLRTTRRGATPPRGATSPTVNCGDLRYTGTRA